MLLTSRALPQKLTELSSPGTDVITVLFPCQSHASQQPWLCPSCCWRVQVRAGQCLCVDAVPIWETTASLRTGIEDAMNHEERAGGASEWVLQKKELENWTWECVCTRASACCRCPEWVSGSGLRQEMQMWDLKWMCAFVKSPTPSPSSDAHSYTLHATCNNWHPRWAAENTSTCPAPDLPACACCTIIEALSFSSHSLRRPQHKGL